MGIYFYKKDADNKYQANWTDIVLDKIETNETIIPVLDFRDSIVGLLCSSIPEFEMEVIKGISLFDILFVRSGEFLVQPSDRLSPEEVQRQLSE